MTTESLETTVDESQQGLLRRIYTEEWATMGNHLTSVGISLGASAGFFAGAQDSFTSDIELAAATSLVDVSTYWISLVSQLAFRDRKKMRNSDGSFSFRSLGKKMGEYGILSVFMETLYLVARTYAQCRLQKEGMDPTTASTIAQSTLAGAYTFILPPMRYALRQWSER
ncbi:hypothetical protein J4410_02395 [Candidatus Woesearchaeota archaeon]|nr:hypothetical protein [Candidatus Woesearchaeota archaeon]